MKRICLPIFFVIFLLVGLPALLQAQPQRQVNKQNQLWVSINSLMKFTPKWGLIADFHVRRTDFGMNPNFYFIRFGANYWISRQLSMAAGYGHMWVANKGMEGNTIYANENRIYQQFQYNTKFKKAGLVLRLRNEQRWQQKISNGQKLEGERFTNRVRYLTGFNYQVFKDERLPKLMLADEIAVQFGKEVVYNTFDQNRFTIGIQQRISKTVSFDIGYMLVYQQKYSGYQYDRNNTFRLFFYYTPDFSKADTR